MTKSSTNKHKHIELKIKHKHTKITLQEKDVYMLACNQLCVFGLTGVYSMFK